MRRLFVLLRVALPHLRVRVRQTVVATLGVAVGVGFFLAVSSMMVGSQEDFIRTLVDSAPHIIVRDEQRDPSRQPAADVFAGGAVEVRGVRPQDEVRGLKDWPAMLADARAIPGAVASPTLSGAVSARFAGRTEGLAISGVDPRLQGQITKIEGSLIGGRLLDLEARSDGLIISKPLADRLGAKIGDLLVVSSPAGGLQRMQIVALTDPQAGTGAFYGGDNAAYALLRTAQVLFARPNVVNQIHIKLADPDAAETEAGRLEARWRYKWESWQERSKDILNLLIVRNVIMWAVTSAILMVASFGIYTAVSTSVTDKRRDIAILRAMGFSEGDVQGIFLIEGMAVGVAGALCGFAFGTALMQILASLPLEVQGRPLELPLDRSARQYGVAGAVSLTAAVIAAWLPARKAASVDPVDILRGAA